MPDVPLEAIMLEEVLDGRRLRYGVCSRVRRKGQLSESQVTARINRLKRVIRLLEGRQIDLFVTGEAG